MISWYKLIRIWLIYQAILWIYELAANCLKPNVIYVLYIYYYCVNIIIELIIAHLPCVESKSTVVRLNTAFGYGLSCYIRVVCDQQQRIISLILCGGTQLCASFVQLILLHRVIYCSCISSSIGDWRRMVSGVCIMLQRDINGIYGGVGGVMVDCN